MKTVEEHIAKDKAILDDPTLNPAARRHYKEELHELEEYVDHHKKEIDAGDHHDLYGVLVVHLHPDCKIQQ